ncbi:MAG: hypothetical protein WBG48_17555 [Pricia sp.]
MEIDFKEREPIWIALSALYLDTELQDYEFRHIARTINASPYDFEKVRNIDKYEVFPILYLNVFSVTGVWSGFDTDWLVKKIAVRIKKRNYFQQRILEVKYLCMKSTFRDYWQKIEQEYLQQSEPS